MSAKALKKRGVNEIEAVPDHLRGTEPPNSIASDPTPTPPSLPPHNLFDQKWFLHTLVFYLSPKDMATFPLISTAFPHLEVVEITAPWVVRDTRGQWPRTTTRFIPDEQLTVAPGGKTPPKPKTLNSITGLEQRKETAGRLEWAAREGPGGNELFYLASFPQPPLDIYYGFVLEGLWRKEHDDEGEGGSSYNLVVYDAGTFPEHPEGVTEEDVSDPFFNSEGYGRFGRFGKEGAVVPLAESEDAMHDREVYDGPYDEEGEVMEQPKEIGIFWTSKNGSGDRYERLELFFRCYVKDDPYGEGYHENTNVAFSEISFYGVKVKFGQDGYLGFVLGKIFWDDDSEEEEEEDDDDDGDN
ncbi:hypothetical protein TrCOL_g8986 [Triparma columacea]|uniref:Uncharacterized protein n=1 Tax=Triparma columacea TaxID=722753 RepID=A0A9W7LFQ9_9STRA|nr:hypothetical protein TrCOL_g8986 [Triparma columacea]